MKNDIIRNGGGNQSHPQQKTPRSSNIELYRIIVMMLIVAHHYVVNSGLMERMDQDTLSSNSLFFYIFGAWGKTGINCFVLITGYFMCTSTITLRKFLKLFLWMETYVIITFVFIALGYCPLGIKTMLLEFIPLKSLTTGFGSCFLVFYLCIPFLNILVRNMNRKQHSLLIYLLLFIYTVHVSIPSLRVNMNYVSWFSVLYFISSYLRLYPIKENQTSFWLEMTCLSFGLSVFSILSLLYIGSKGVYFAPYAFISDSNAIFALTNGITSFMLFKSLKIKNSKIINTIAASSFGVLLIHTNSSTMRQWLWKDTVDCVGHYDTDFYWLYAIGCVLLIYIVCTIIDVVRIKTIETPLLNATETICRKIYSRFTNKKKSI